MGDLFLSGISKRARVLPLVYLNILDHYVRRNNDEARVTGVLLGHMKGVTVEITNSFAVPHSDDEDDTTYIDITYMQRMLELNRKVNPREVVVGWYATGSGAIKQNSVDIHQLFIDNHTADPIHLMVDTSLTTNRIVISALVSSPLGVPGGAAGKVFTPIECQMLLPEPERVALGLMDRSLAQQESTVSLLSDLDHVAESTENLYTMICKALDYVENVIDHKKEGDAAIGRALRDTIAAVPKIDAAKFEGMFNNAVQDLLMLVYLANLTRSQIMLRDKMNEIL